MIRYSNFMNQVGSTGRDKVFGVPEPIRIDWL